ncbi:MAG: hypothetical protein HY895_01840 [Deltaproteobacteria bacterium]|nr:hypothetical protein [Deltaproteobacteria bacterium]
MKTTYYQKCKEHYARFGFGKTMVYLLDRLINSVILADCYHIIVLDREKVKEPSAASSPDISFRFATWDELVDMRKQETWAIDDFLLDRAAEGDMCFLSFCGGELAGYTWANVNGQPLLASGLRLKLPENYIYNYSGFTLPKFRGSGLQSVRHRALMHYKQWGRNMLGFIGYVRYTNWASISGQTKSGYRRVGRVWLFGSKKHFMTLRSREVKDFGIKRIHEFIGADSKRYSTAG